MQDVPPADRTRDAAELYLRASDMPRAIGARFLATATSARPDLSTELDHLIQRAPPWPDDRFEPTCNPDTVARQLHALADAWRVTAQSDLARQLVEVDDSTRPLLLIELVKLDQKCRWAAGQPKALEVYLQEWPELRSHPHALTQLLSSECLARSVYAASPTREELELRFPTAASSVDLAAIEARAAVTAALRAPVANPHQFTDRFVVMRKIGEGGMGRVYEVLDRHRGIHVALKTLVQLDATNLYRFKREFRRLCGLVHPNLVSLYELISDGHQWFFTMELIRGVHFLAHLHGADSTTHGPPDAAPGSTAPTGPIVADQARLRAALRQLVEGVAALHAEGILHRDLKPSNVLVRDDGRLVIVDVGVARELSPVTAAEPAAAEPAVPRGDDGWTLDEGIVGSIAYMSPEQAAAEPLTEASDWYSVGVMLYEALTGVVPFAGESLDVLLRKRSVEADPPGTRAAGVPADLEQLCIALLRRDPRERPGGRELLARLATGPGGARPAPPVRASAFVGREHALAVLASAYRALERGQPSAVHVRGRSGAGKTALVQRFLATLPPPTLVLAGRCYEQESVPYKALDSVVDEIGRWLSRCERHQAHALVPPDIAALARVFPVLERVDVIREAVAGRPEIPDVRELRRRAFAALGEMLRRMAATSPLVMAIDDLQWGDVDSAALLISLLGPPAPPPLLLIASYRTEAAEQNPCLVALDAARAHHASVEVQVEELSLDEARQLAALLLGADARHAAHADRIARESGGNPYFVYELARQVEEADRDLTEVQPPRRLELDEVLWRRAAMLDPAARQLLEVVAVAGKPLPLRVAADAAALGDQSAAAVATLHAERLIRATGPALDDFVETYHDRIRESIVTRLVGAAHGEHHRRLAAALERAGHPDLESTAVHFHRGGLREKAGVYYGRAADKAWAALAFGRSAELYGLAIELHSGGAEARRRLLLKRADALANAGRGYEAGRAYQAATGGAPDTQVVELQRKAGYQYFVSGHIDEGRQAFETVLAPFGMHLARTRRRALLSLLRQRLQLRLRGMAFEERPERDVPAGALERVDIFWSVAAGMTIADPIRGAEYQTFDLRLALDAGEPYRIARALAWEAAHISMGGVRHRARAEAQLVTAEMLATRLDRPHANGMVRMSRGVVAYFTGDVRQCHDACAAAAGIFRSQCTGVSWELETCNAFALWSLYFRGLYAELSQRFSTLISEVRQRGARLAEADLTTFGGPFVFLAADDPDGAARAVASVMGEWSTQDFQVQHFTTLTAETQIDLYRGDGRAAWERIRSHWAGVADAMLLHVEIVRVYMLHLRARAALAAIGSGPDSRMLIASASRDARRLSRERPLYARALARTIDAALAAERGDRQRALALMGSAADELDRLGWGCFGDSARRLYGLLLGGEDGRRIARQVEDRLSSQGVKRPDRLAAVHVPGGRFTA